MVWAKGSGALARRAGEGAHDVVQEVFAQVHIGPLADAEEVAHEKAHVPEGLQVDVVVGVGAVGDVEGAVLFLPEGDLGGHDGAVGNEGSGLGAGHGALDHPLWEH